MKRLFIIALSLAAGSMGFKANAQATQTAANDQMRFGIKAGANMTKISDYRFLNQDYSTDYKAGFQAGVYADLPMGGGFAFLPEITFTQKGFKLKETVDGNTGEINSKINYLDIPVLIGYRPSPEFTIFAGPQASFLLSQKTEVRANGTEVTNTTDTDALRKSIAGGVIGLGYSITPNINVNGRYMMDFQSTAKEDQNQKGKLNGFALSLGYTF